MQDKNAKIDEKLRARKCFEAGVQNLAFLHLVSREFARAEIKKALVDLGYIAQSTTELYVPMLDRLARGIAKECARLAATPPAERPAFRAYLLISGITKFENHDQF